MSNFAAPDPIFRVCVSGRLLSEMATQIAEGFEKPAREIILSVLAVGRWPVRLNCMFLASDYKEKGPSTRHATRDLIIYKRPERS